MNSTQSNREIGDKYEKKVAKKLGGKRIQGSGSSRERKEDIDFPGIRMQVKFTAGKSISIKAKDLERLQEHALDVQKVPALLFGVNGGETEWIAFPRWSVQALEWFCELVGSPLARKSH